jgi:exodeoxyribonuclease VII large subunit
MQPSLFGTLQWTVSSLTRYIREALESDVQLQDVWVRGEVSNLSRPASGHVYFTLKDAGASLRCVVWRSGVSRLGTELQDGLAIAAHGRIGVYEGAGQYQLYTDAVRAAGEGELYQEFLRRKAALEAEGLFATERKRPLPDLPRRIGIVTSPTGAAVQDVLNTLGRRMPMLEAFLAPSQVQGVEAPAQLIKAVRALNELRPALDVILLVRGGGSIEDLWAFNDEGVVRSVVESDVPVVAGVGHETDFTLVDFAADVRAPTPTAAAEVATPITLDQLRVETRGSRLRLESAILELIAGLRGTVAGAAQTLQFRSPARRIRSDLQRIDEFGRRSETAARQWLALHGETLQGWEKRLEALSPLSVLGRGYAVVTRHSDGVIVRSVAQAQDRIGVRVSDGSFEAEVRRDGP